MTKKLTDILKQLGKLKTDLFQKDFLLTWDKTPDELNATLLLAEALRQLHRDNVSCRCFTSGLAVSNFRDNSTRTRFSFASASNLLGLTVQDLDEGKSQIAHGETVRETANMISFCAEAIGSATTCSWARAMPTCAKSARRWTTASPRACCRSDLRSSTCSATSTTRRRAWPISRGCRSTSAVSTSSRGSESR